MTSSKEVFAKRREGQLDEAYRMALQLMNSPNPDEWDTRAFGWCLIDLIKRDARAERVKDLDHYRQQLEAIEIPIVDEVFATQREQAILLCKPNGLLASKAKQASKSGRHSEAVDIYRQLLRAGEDGTDNRTSLGWELYKLSKELMAKKSIDILAVKRNLNEYLKLNIGRPSLLHSCFLQVASKLASEEKINMLAFSQFWNLEFLRAEDWQKFVTDDGKEFPSLAEKVIQQVSKGAINKNDNFSLSYVLPHLDRAIVECPENVWLLLNKAKVLLALGRNNDALNFALDVTRAKINDYWAWSLLGDICADSENNTSLSCYCKSLLCYADDKFTGKVRIKLAKQLINNGNFSEAKYELNRVIANKEKECLKLPAEVVHMSAQPWYLEVSPTSSNDAYYRENAQEAEMLLVSQLPWVDANIGDVFVIPGKENRPKRKLFLKTLSEPKEVVIQESKMQLSDVVVGDAIRLKGEFNSQGVFQVYVIDKRESNESWDVFFERIGVVDHVNNHKQLIHFIVDRKVDGVIHFSDLSSVFSEGEAISVNLSVYTTRQGARYRVLRADHTDKEPDSSIRKSFREKVRISNGMGFTKTDIFIPPPIISKNNIEDDDFVSGVALINYNKKRDSWGWKAISATSDTIE